jgi:hypothetical protein
MSRLWHSIFSNHLLPKKLKTAQSTLVAQNPHSYWFSDVLGRTTSTVLSRQISQKTSKKSHLRRSQPNHESNTWSQSRNNAETNCFHYSSSYHIQPYHACRKHALLQFNPWEKPLPPPCRWWLVWLPKYYKGWAHEELQRADTLSLPNFLCLHSEQHDVLRESLPSKCNSRKLWFLRIRNGLGVER